MQYILTEEEYKLFKKQFDYTEIDILSVSKILTEQHDKMNGVKITLADGHTLSIKGMVLEHILIIAQKP